MQTRLNPYLGFRDNAREALEFYKSVFGGNLEISTFKEFGASQDPSEDDKVMHGMLTIGDSMVIMASDTPNSMRHAEESNISLSLSGDNDEELTGYFNKLAEGGRVTMPLEKAMWGDKFGMLTDKFGTSWMVNIAGQAS
jgi:PhnB protein